MPEHTARRAAELYNVAVDDWPGEINFYRALAGNASVLELACGTGRVAVRLARQGATVIGLDNSVEMLAVARTKGADLPNLSWIEADMRSFDLDRTFDLVIAPGHAFQNLSLVEEQLACLACIRRHLMPGGTLALHLDHQDVDWLGEIGADKRGVMEPAGQITDPTSGNLVRSNRAWAYDRSTQTASTWAVYEEVDNAGQIVDRWESGPVGLHCFFRYEVEHLLVRAGFRVEAVYGDFYRGPLNETSAEMIWVAKA